MGKEKEKQVTSAKTRRQPLARKETTSSVPEETLPQSGPAPLKTEIPHRPDTAPAEIGSLSVDRYPTPQPEAGRRTKSRARKWRNRPQQEDQDALKSRQPSDPPHVDKATESDDAGAASSKNSGDGPNPPKGDIIDLTIKEESPTPSPNPPAQVPGPNGLEAGCVRFVVFGLWGNLTRN